MRSHPPALLKNVLRTLRAECRATAEDRILVAVSGGIDSMTLLHALSVLRPRLRFSLVAHGVDHGLREAAVQELDTAARFARQLEVPFSRSKVELRSGGNIQHRARELRYAALETAAEHLDATLIATAHHADDRAETVLLRLLRGAGPEGLAVLPVRAGRRIRPLVRATRADIAAHAERHRIPSHEDPSNADRRFLRSQVRHELLPLLERMSPGIRAHLNALADALLETQGADAGVGHVPHGLNRAQFRALTAALQQGKAGPRIRISDRLELCLQRASPVRPGRNRHKP
jgi:tRNA(Ile)-lysidine synthase